MGKENKGKIKMTVIHFETESENATLQENVRAIAHTLTRALTSHQRIISPAQLTTADGGATSSISEEEEMDGEDAIDDETEIPPSTSPASKKKGGGARQYRTPQPVDLDLTSGDIPLKDFLDQKKAENDIRRYLLIAYWLKTRRNVEEVTMDHAYTCFRHMGWQVPPDAGLPFRIMKRKQYGWLKTGSNKGAYVINHLGENEVEKMGNA